MALLFVLADQEKASVPEENRIYSPAIRAGQGTTMNFLMRLLANLMREMDQGNLLQVHAQAIRERQRLDYDFFARMDVYNTLIQRQIAAENGVDIIAIEPLLYTPSQTVNNNNNNMGGVDDEEPSDDNNGNQAPAINNNRGWGAYAGAVVAKISIWKFWGSKHHKK